MMIEFESFTEFHTARVLKVHMPAEVHSAGVDVTISYRYSTVLSVYCTYLQM